MTVAAPDLFTSILRPERVRLALDSGNSAAAIRELLQPWNNDPDVIDLSSMFEEFLERDRLQPTSLGHGIAFRHIRTDAAKVIIMGIGRSAVGLKSLSSPEPIHLLILLATPKRFVREYLAILSTLARQLSDPARRQDLLTADQTSQFIERLSLPVATGL